MPDLTFRFWLAVIDLLNWCGAGRAYPDGLRWRAYLWAVSKAGECCWGGVCDA